MGAGWRLVVRRHASHAAPTPSPTRHVVSPAAAAGDKVVKIWDVQTGRFEKNLIGHEQGVSDLSWSCDSSYITTASDDKTVRIWDVKSVLRCPQYPVRHRARAPPARATHELRAVAAGALLAHDGGAHELRLLRQVQSPL